MKVLIAIITCHKFSYKAQAQRETWVPNVRGADVKFFYGIGERKLLPDEVLLDVADDYKSLPYKIKAMVRWALDRDYDYIFKVDDDVYVWPNRLMSCGFEQTDYMGRHNTSGWISGGPGYWLSRRAAKIVAGADKIDDWAEDRGVGSLMAQAGIKGTYNDLFCLLPNWQFSTLDLITACDTTGGFDMYAWHETQHCQKVLSPEFTQILCNPTPKDIAAATKSMLLITTRYVDLTRAELGYLLGMMDKYQMAGGSVHVNGSAFLQAGLFARLGGGRVGYHPVGTNYFNHNGIRFRPVEFLGDYFLVKTEWMKRQPPWKQGPQGRAEWFFQIRSDEERIVVCPDCVADYTRPESAEFSNPDLREVFLP